MGKPSLHSVRWAADGHWPILSVSQLHLLSYILRIKPDDYRITVSGGRKWFFKPNISTMVGQLYAPGDARTDAAYTIFYMGINLGAFFSPLICGTLGDTSNPADFRWGFLSACIGMLVGLALF